MTPPDATWVSIPCPAGNHFHERNFETWGRLDGDEPVLGFRVLEQHCNPRKVCHGGMLMTFCDFLLPTISRLTDPAHDHFTPTISMTSNFLAPARLHTWLEGRGRVVRRSTNLLFVEATIGDGMGLVLQASGIFKRGNPDHRRAGSTELLERMRRAQDARLDSR